MTDEYIASVDKDFRVDGLNLVVETKPRGQFYGSNEWLLPSLFTMYVLKPFFEEFLKEAGKDCYHLLINGVKNAIINLKHIKITSFVSTGSEDKINQINTQSNAFSIQSVMDNGVTLKFMFDNNLNIEQWQTASISALILLEDYFKNKVDNQLTKMLGQVGQAKGNMIFAIINTETLTWELKTL